jgi:uncharacterized protein YgbK (DUF1537 family)
MLLGCIADDFTGASDLANTLAKNGMSTVQFSGVPNVAFPPCEAGVVALKTRSIPPADAVAQSLSALEWLRTQGCTQFLFKYCSTFDSTHIGNIGPVAEALLNATGGDVAVVCPAFPQTGRTLYQGHLFVGDRLLSESGMEKHPLTPMTDPDIRRWLALQTRLGVGWIGHHVVRRGGAAIRAALQAEAAADRRLVVADAVTDDDLLAIGSACADLKLVTGGSGIAQGLPANFEKTGMLGLSTTRFTGKQGRGVVLSGSCSTASRAQLSHHLHRHPGLALDPGSILDRSMSVDDAIDFVRGHGGRSPAVYSTADPEKVTAIQSRYGRDRVAVAIERFFGELASRLVADGVARIVVGGGETSGAVAHALGAQYFLVGPEIDPGVPALATRSGEHDLRLALKSGNFGSIGFYDKALNVLQSVEAG